MSEPRVQTKAEAQKIARGNPLECKAVTELRRRGPNTKLLEDPVRAPRREASSEPPRRSMSGDEMWRDNNA